MKHNLKTLQKAIGAMTYPNKEPIHDYLAKFVEELQQLKQHYKKKEKWLPSSTATAIEIIDEILGVKSLGKEELVEPSMIPDESGENQQCKHIWQKETLFNIVSCSKCGEIKQG